MKKLMIAAAAAAMTCGAFAATDVENPLVYNLKWNLKTLGEKDIQCGKDVCTVCKSSEKSTKYYLETASRKLEGLMASCETCFDGMPDASFWNRTTTNDVLFLVWDKTAGAAISGTIDAGDVTIDDALENDDYDNPVRMYNRYVTTKKVGGETVAYTNDIVVADYKVQVFGKSFTKAAVELDIFQAYWKVATESGMVYRDYNLGAVAFGSFDYKNKCVKSVSGNVVGDIPLYKGAQWLAQYGICLNADYCNATATFVTLKAPAYGTFSMKLNTGAAKKAIAASVPSYMK